MLNLHSKLIGLLFTFLIIFCDTVSKILATKLAPTQSEGIVTFQLAYNKGVAFGLLPEQSTIITILGALFSCYILYLMVHIKSAYINITLGVLLGGVLGNLIERILFGRVTDFISLKGFAIINIADIAIVLALITHIILLISNKHNLN